jgi:hypothetical protein
MGTTRQRPEVPYRVTPATSTLAAETQLTAHDLGIDLASRREEEYAKWFLACLLCGKPVQQQIVPRTYAEFVRAQLITPAAISATAWETLVQILDRGQYVRFDSSTATRLITICTHLCQEYGTLTHLFARSVDAADLAARIHRFVGIGPVTTRILLHDLAPLLFGNRPGEGQQEGTVTGECNAI